MSDELRSKAREYMNRVYAINKNNPGATGHVWYGCDVVQAYMDGAMSVMPLPCETTDSDRQLAQAAKRVIDRVEINLPKWRAWFANDEHPVEVPRCDLLALIHFAKKGMGG